MTNYLRGRRMTLGLLLTAIFLTAQAVVGVTAAEARCAGVNQGFTSTLGAGTALVVEAPVSGTCNNNNLYTGQVRRDVGYIGEVSVYIQNGGVWRQAIRTNSRSFVRYEVTDTNSNTFMTLCWYERDAPSIGVAHCGWGSNYGPVGTTPGTHPNIYNSASLHGVNSGF